MLEKSYDSNKMTDIVLRSDLTSYPEDIYRAIVSRHVHVVIELLEFLSNELRSYFSMPHQFHVTDDERESAGILSSKSRQPRIGTSSWLVEIPHFLAKKGSTFECNLDRLVAYTQSLRRRIISFHEALKNQFGIILEDKYFPTPEKILSMTPQEALELRVMLATYLDMNFHFLAAQQLLEEIKNMPKLL